MKNLSTIVKSFSKTLSDLEVFINKTNNQIEQREFKIHDLTQENVGARKERDRAKEISANIEKLLAGK